ncbi:MAG: NAD(P)-dependent oxidoreductase [Clostridium sp.]|uniref:NAD(P)-dependent oxidoreductase n=1 Tax=Clostridium sp. TaxID=1506 RepID=UPI002FC8FB0D
MYEDSREDIHREKLEYIMLSLLSNKIDVLIIGGGEAAFIKVKTFLDRGCNVKVIAKEVSKEIYSLKSDRLIISIGEFTESLLENYHIVVIAINDKLKVKEIKAFCDKSHKIYINSTNYKDGLGALPINIKSDEALIGINTFKGNPKALKVMSSEMSCKLKSFDEFIRITSIIRNNSKNFKDKKKEILDFIICNEFKDVIENGHCKLLLRLFYEEELVNKLFED